MNTQARRPRAEPSPDAPLAPKHVALCCRAHALSGIAVSMRRLAARSGFALLVCGPGPAELDHSGSPPDHHRLHARVPWSSGTPVMERVALVRAAAEAAGARVLVPNDLPEASLAAALEPALPALAWAHGDDDDAHDLYERTFALASARRAVHPSMARRLEDELRAGPVGVLRCGVELPEPWRQSLDAGESARDTFGRALRVLWAGWMDRRNKRAHDLPPIMRQLSARSVRVELTIAGDGPAAHDVRAQIAEATPPGSCVMLGRVPAGLMPSLHCSHDLLLMTSRSEGAPVVAMEALAAGRGLVVTTGCGAATDLVEQAARAAAPVGMVAPTGDAPALAARLHALANDRARVLAWGRAARALAERELCIERCTAELLDAAQEASRAKRPPREPALVWALAHLAAPADGLNDADRAWLTASFGPPPPAPPFAPWPRRVERRFARAISTARAQGATRIMVYGDGAHTRRIGAAIERAGVVAIVDDRYESQAPPPAAITRLSPTRALHAEFDALICSSDEYEHALLKRAADWAGGRLVLGLYENGPEDGAPRHRAAA